MPLAGALFAGVTGLDTNSTAISVIGDNIANSNTIGFKGRRVEFADILGQSIAAIGGFSQTGAGARTARISQQFSQGTFESTNRATDLAIEGRGFFVLNGAEGTFYSRAGIFDIDNQGFLVNPQGLRLQGFGVDPATGQSNGQIGDIQLVTTLSPPRSTTTMDLSVNLDASPASPPAVGTLFDPANVNATTQHRVVMTLFDSLGNPHAATVYFNKLSEAGSPPVHRWQFTVATPPSETTIPPGAGDEVVIQQNPAGGAAQGVLQFDANGVLQQVEYPSGTVLTANPTIRFQFSGGAAPDQDVTLNFGPPLGQGDATTQFAADTSTTNAFSQDGFGPGTIQRVSIDDDGFLTVQFSNGETQNLAQIALASFPNVQGLLATGNNNFVESRDSGQALIGEPGSGGFGSIRASNLEQSNVDLATEFVKLIINQRAFQANTRTISVTNELLANLVALGQ